MDHPSIIIMQSPNRQRQSNSHRSPSFNLSLIPTCSSVAVRLLAMLCFFCLHGTSFSQKAEEPKGTVAISMLSGPSLMGSILHADNTKVVIETKLGPIEKKSGDVGKLVFPNPIATSVAPVELTMMDGSKALGDQLIGKSNLGWKLRIAPEKEVVVQGKSLKAARLKTIGPELANAWQSAIQETKTSDAVIVLRPGNNLDRINGVIVQVQEASVTFDLDGQQIDIPIEKLIGLVWFQRDLERIKPTIEVVLTNGSVWMAETFSLDTKLKALELKTQLGQTLSIPRAEIASIDYATANIRWLSELEPLEAVAEKQIEFRTPIAALERAFLPRFVVNGTSAKPNSQPGDKDLQFSTPGHYLFRVPEGFSSLQSRIERTGDGPQRTDLTIEVWQEDQRVSELPLLHNVDFVDLEVGLKPEKRTKLVVVCKSKLLIGIEVVWKQPRLKR